MKRRSKEINIFSMSALDLFASGMGAFILITIILIPYFPNTGDSPERVAEVKAQLASSQAALQKSKDEKEALERSSTEAQQKMMAALAKLEALKNAPHLQFPPLDLVIALDSTGSMKEQVNGIRNEIGQLSKLLVSFSPDVGIGIIDFKDRCDTAAVTAFTLQKITSSNLSSISNFTDAIRAGGDPCNQDGPEAFAQALNKAINMSWRNATKVKVIVMITDNPAYPEVENEVLGSARRFASRGNGFYISTVYANTGASAPGTIEFLQAVATAGKGEFVDGGGSFTATILLALVGI